MSFLCLLHRQVWDRALCRLSSWVLSNNRGTVRRAGVQACRGWINIGGSSFCPGKLLSYQVQICETTSASSSDISGTTIWPRHSTFSLCEEWEGSPQACPIWSLVWATAELSSVSQKANTLSKSRFLGPFQPKMLWIYTSHSKCTPILLHKWGHSGECCCWAETWKK